MSAANSSRRRFFQQSAAVAGGLVVGFHIPFAREAAAQAVAGVSALEQNAGNQRLGRGAT
jgi:hypothetical protein